MLHKVRDVVSMLPPSYRIRLHNLIALPLIQIGGSLLAGGRLTYEAEEAKRVVGFRSERFAQNEQ
jgi:hypothetical protein